MTELDDKRGSLGLRAKGWVRDHPLTTVFLAAFIPRLVTAVLIWLLAGGALFGDELTFTHMAQAVAAGETWYWDDFTHWLYWRTAAWTYPLTAVYWVFGNHIIVGQVLAALLGAATASLTTAIARRFTSTWPAIFAGLAVGLLPSQILWSALTLKDAAVWFATAAAGLAIVWLGREGGVRWPVASFVLVLSLVGVAFLRMHSFIVAVWSAGICLALAAEKDRKWSGVLGAASLTILLPLAVGLGPAGLTFVAEELGSVDSRRAANQDGAATALERFYPEPGDPDSPRSGAGPTEAPADGSGATGDGSGTTGDGSGTTGDGSGTTGDGSGATGDGSDGSGTTADDESSTVPEIGEDGLEDESVSGTSGEQALKPLARGLLVMLAEPIPTRDITNPRVRLAQLDLLIWYPLLAAAAIGMWATARQRRLIYPLLYVGGMTMVYALTEGNFGTAFRHRGELVWGVAVFASIGLERIISMRRWKPLATDESGVDA